MNPVNNHPLRRHRRNRPGVTAMLAMLFLVLFSVLSLGFYALITTSVAVSGSEQHAAHAMLAAESGMEYVRYHLGNVHVPPQTSDANLVQAVYDDLFNLTKNTASMSGQNVGIGG